MLSANRSGYLGCALALLLGSSLGHAGPNAGGGVGGGTGGGAHASSHENGGADETNAHADAAQNYVWAGPTSGSGAPVFRALVDADIPATLDLTGGTHTGSGLVSGYIFTPVVLQLPASTTAALTYEATCGWDTDDDRIHCGDGVGTAQFWRGSTTAAANRSVVSDGSGKIADGWLSSLVSLLGQTIGAAEMADGDHGDFTYSSGVATLDADVVGDAEMATTEKIVQAILLSVTASDSVVMRTLPVATSVTRVECETFGAAGTETATIEICLGDDAGDDTCDTSVNGGTIVCDADGQADTVIANPALTARQQISVVISAVSGTVDALEVYVEGTR